jgi:hypothetical protein
LYKHPKNNNDFSYHDYFISFYSSESVSTSFAAEVYFYAPPYNCVGPGYDPRPENCWIGEWDLQESKEGKYDWSSPNNPLA